MFKRWGANKRLSIIRRKTGARQGARVGNNQKSIHWRSFIVEFLSGSFALGLVSNQLAFVGVEAELLEGGGHSSRPWQQSELVLPNGGVSAAVVKESSWYSLMLRLL